MACPAGGVSAGGDSADVLRDALAASPTLVIALQSLILTENKARTIDCVNRTPTDCETTSLSRSRLRRREPLEVYREIIIGGEHPCLRDGKKWIAANLRDEQRLRPSDTHQR